MAGGQGEVAKCPDPNATAPGQKPSLTSSCVFLQYSDHSSLEPSDLYEQWNQT